MNSRNKGKRGERDWCEFLRQRGYDARRGQQYRGGEDAPDVVCPRLGWLHMEVKRSERLRIREAMEQAAGDAGPGQVPIVAHRENGKEWLVTLRAEAFVNLLTAISPPCEGGSGDGENNNNNEKG